MCLCERPACEMSIKKLVILPVYLLSFAVNIPEMTMSNAKEPPKRDPIVNKQHRHELRAARRGQAVSLLLHAARQPVGFSRK